MVQVGEKYLLSSTFQIHIVSFFLTAALCLWKKLYWEAPGGREGSKLFPLSSHPPASPPHLPFLQAGALPSISSIPWGLNAASEEGLLWKRKIRLVTGFHTRSFSPRPPYFWFTQRQASSPFLARLQHVPTPAHCSSGTDKWNPAFKRGYSTSLLKISKATLGLKRDLCWSLFLDWKNIFPLNNVWQSVLFCFVFFSKKAVLQVSAVWENLAQYI